MTFFGRCMMVFILICSGLFIFAAPSGAAPAFAPGEQIRYSVKWQMYEAGEAVVRALPKNGGAVWRFELKMRTNPFLDKFFKVRDHLESTVAKDFSSALAYAYTATGKEKKQIHVSFFKEPARAVYQNFDEVRDPIEIPAGSLDPLASFFKLRTLDMIEGKTLSFPVTDGKKAFMQMGEVIGRETVDLPSGTWKTIVVVPWVTHFSGVFEKSRDPTVRVWISDDDRRIPLRIRIRVVVGSIYFDMAEYRPGLSGEAGPP